MQNQTLTENQQVGTDREPTENRAGTGPESIRCMLCNRLNVNIYKYEFGQKASKWSFEKNAEIPNPEYAIAYLCSTDLTLASRIRHELGRNTPTWKIMEAMSAYRQTHPIKSND